MCYLSSRSTCCVCGSIDEKFRWLKAFLIMHFLLLFCEETTNTISLTAITMFCGTDNIMWNILRIRSQWWNILHNIVNPAKHCYGSLVKLVPTFTSHTMGRFGQLSTHFFLLPFTQQLISYAQNQKSKVMWLLEQKNSETFVSTMCCTSEFVLYYVVQYV